MLASHHPVNPVNKVRQIVVTEANEGQRIDNFLFTLLRGVPKSHVYRIIRKGEVRVNKGRISVSYKLVLGDTVRVPPLRVEDQKPQIRPTSKIAGSLVNAICYEDDQLLIIDKPAGLAVHGGSGVSMGLIEALRAMRPDASFLELVHRLDKDTSGCVMIAKKRSMLLHLHEALLSGKIEKKYNVLVSGRWSAGKIVEAPLQKYTLRSGERVVKVQSEGKQAKTLFKVQKMFLKHTLLQAMPVTGRTHQIRVHCAYMGYPIVGDEKYGDATINKQAKEKGFDRLFLHAHELKISLPYSPYTITVSSSLPEVCEQFCQILNQ